jgi:hypothetical protein
MSETKFGLSSAAHMNGSAIRYRRLRAVPTSYKKKDTTDSIPFVLHASEYKRASTCSSLYTGKGKRCLADGDPVRLAFRDKGVNMIARMAHESVCDPATTASCSSSTTFGSATQDSQVGDASLRNAGAADAAAEWRTAYSPSASTRVTSAEHTTNWRIEAMSSNSLLSNFDTLSPLSLDLSALVRARP